MLLKHSTLKDRAVPNERLVKVFNIDNAFTTTDRKWHKEVLVIVKDLLVRDETAWKWSADFSSQLARTAGSTRHPTSFITVVELVQVLVFKMVHSTFFSDLPTPSDSDVTLCTTTINSLWIESKCIVNHLGHIHAKARKDLESMLQKNFKPNPGTSITGRYNPLNIILPAYETLWRVVLRCFLEITSRTPEHRFRVYNQLLRAFLDNPTKHTFEAQTSDVSVKYIVSEALRLYPPTRRIYRQVDNLRLAVDVEYIHRDPSHWGPNALIFDPKRWNSIPKRVVAKAYMPFGKSKFECPARPIFAPMMIGILVAALVMQFAEGYEMVGEEEDDDPKAEGPLKGGRSGYEGLHLIKTEAVK
jgi:hypothetical protein